MSDAAKNDVARTKAPFIFYLILAVIPVLFFVLLESGLRLADYGYSYQLFSEKEGGVKNVLYVNPDISYKYFGSISSPVFNAEVGFYEHKPDSSFRVFVLGGSSTQGFPYNLQASFPAHLKRRLALQYPEKLIEMVNLGASAINSYTLRDILPEVLAQEPDLILLYAGHNEYYGALGAGSARSVSPALANVLLNLREFRTVQLLENILGSVTRQTVNNNKSLMQKMIGESLIAYDSKTFGKGLEQYDKNLSAILQMINEAGIPAMIGTLTSNIGDQQPFNASQLSTEGLSALDYFARGKELLAAGQAQEAKANFVLAKEYDGLRFRAPEEMNRIIREKAAASNIPVVDIEKSFSLNSPNKITGANLMCDHLHPNRQGYYFMAKVFGEAIINNNILPAPRVKYEPGELDTLLLEQFPYTAFDTLVDNHILYSGLGQYPFVEPGAPNPYQEILDNDGINFNTAAIRTKDSLRALIAHNHLMKQDSNAFTREMAVFLSYFPWNEISYFHAINLLSQQGSLSIGYPLLYKSLTALDESLAKKKALGMYFKSMQEYGRALEYLEAALQAHPMDILVLLDIGFTQFALGNYADAEKSFEAVIHLDPDNQEAYHQRSVARFELKNYAGTIEDITQAMELRDAPDTLSYIIRGFAYLGVNDRNKACEDWKQSALLGSRQAQMLIKNYCRN